MDRLLRAAFEKFIRAGSLRRHDRGRVDIYVRRRHRQRRWRSASPTRQPSAASCSIPSSSSAKPTWTARSWSSKARSPTCLPLVLQPGPPGRRAALGAAAMAVALPQAPAAAVQSAPARAAQRRASLRSRRAALRFVPRCRPAIQLRLFRNAGPVARRRPARQEAPSRRQAAARSRDQRVLDIGCGWGGLALYLAETMRRTGHRHHALGGAARAGARCAQRSERCPTQVEFRLQDYRDVPEKFDRIVSVGMFEHVGVGFYDAFFRKCADTARRRRRHGAAFDRPLRGPERHQSLDRQIHLPGRLHSGAVGGAAGDRARGPAGHRHRDPAPALRRDAQGLARALPRASRGGRAALRRTLRADVGVLSRRLRDGVPRAGDDGVPDPADQAAGRRADDARLHRATRRSVCARSKAASRPPLRLAGE